MDQRIGPGDSRYQAVVDRRFNKRFSARPEWVRLAASTESVVAAVNDAVSAGKRLVVTSGGHCLEGFVSDPAVKVVLDVSPMKRVYHDPRRNAIAVEAGATVGETYRALADGWGTMIPLGQHPQIGMGGHVAGGAFGFFHRQFGLAADHLYAVEVVSVDAAGTAGVVVATREDTDPNRDLWWAHTGGGAGIFGVATRFWFRSPGTSGNDPAGFLPRAPKVITSFRAEWKWADLDRSTFVRLLANHGTWSERNAAPDSPNRSLFTLLAVHRRQLGMIVTRGVSTAGAGAEGQFADYLAALSAGVPPPSPPQIERLSWLEFVLNPWPELFAAPPGGVRVKVKDALLRRRLSDQQIGVAHDHLTSTDHDVMGGMLGLATYGGRINAVAPAATASVQRGSILDLACTTGWLDPAEDARNLAWVRAFYRDLFAASGGVPAPGDACEGAMINHPDADLADPVLNTSGVPWHALYHGQNHERLQRIKARWDPGNVFRHALSVHPDAGSG